MEIAIARHGKPEPLPKTRITASEVPDWIHRYNLSGLEPTSFPPQEILTYAGNNTAIISSTLQRAIESANALNSTLPPLADTLFIEAGLPSANWKYFKLSPHTWSILFRILWALGYSTHSESLTEARQRASLAVEKLTDIAQKHQRVLFIGHGIFNQLLAKELRQQGWSGPRKASSNYWGLTIYSA